MVSVLAALSTMAAESVITVSIIFVSVISESVLSVLFVSALHPATAIPANAKTNKIRFTIIVVNFYFRKNRVNCLENSGQESKFNLIDI
jgi:hypothetical protein